MVATVVVVVVAPATVVVALVVVVVAPATVVVGLAVVVVVVVPPSREAPVVLKVNASKCREKKMQLPGIILEKQNEGKCRQSCLFIFMETDCLAII